MAQDDFANAIRYGPGLPTEAELRLLGDVAGRRVVELGQGPRAAAVALAAGGAHVIAVDPSAERLARGRTLADDDEVRVEWHQSDLADLAFLRGDSVDVALSIETMAEVPDAPRLFRQVHRVLKHGGTFLFAYEHPLSMCRPAGDAPPRSYFDATPLATVGEGVVVQRYPRTVSAVFTALCRTGFRVEVLAEPEPLVGSPLVPPTIVWRARKEGA